MMKNVKRNLKSMRMQYHTHVFLFV